MRLKVPDSFYNGWKNKPGKCQSLSQPEPVV